MVTELRVSEFTAARGLMAYKVIIVLLVATTSANAQGHFRPGTPSPPGECGIVVAGSRNRVARMPEGHHVNLKTKKKVVYARSDAGHHFACWNN
jgi:hypothetical protein